MRPVAGRALWLGNSGDLRDARAVLAAGIEAVVELSDAEPLAALPRELIRCRFPLSDGGENPSWLLRMAAESVATLLEAGVPVLVSWPRRCASRLRCIASQLDRLSDALHRS